MMIRQVSFGVIVVLILFLFSCQKEEAFYMEPVPSTMVASSNWPPVVDAGSDFTIQLPFDSSYLNGRYTTQNHISKIEWKKLSGPGGNFENPNLLRTKINALEVGVYFFELAVTDNVSNIARDTVKVTVLDKKSVTAAMDSIQFNQLNWIFPWYNSLEIPNIHAQVPRGASIRVYVRRGFNINWIEAFPITSNPNNHVYEYFIETRPDGAGMYQYGSLYVFYYGSDVSDRPNIKVTF